MAKSKSDKLYGDSPKMERDEKSGKMGIKKPSPKEAEATIGDGEPITAKQAEEVKDMHTRHENERSDMNGRHEKELKMLHAKHEKEGKKGMEKEEKKAEPEAKVEATK
jgi:hypothetical protein